MGIIKRDKPLFASAAHIGWQSQRIDWLRPLQNPCNDASGGLNEQTDHRLLEFP